MHNEFTLMWGPHFQTFPWVPKVILAALPILTAVYRFVLMVKCVHTFIAKLVAT